jgi:hypothetical protein
MLRRFVAAAAFATLALGGAPPARADGFYFAEGLGGSRFTGDADEAGLHLRVAGGFRAGHLGVEVFAQPVFNLGVAYDSDRDGRITPSSAPNLGELGTFGVDLKVIQPLSTHWSAYARGGLSHMSSSLTDYAGRGLQATAGLQLAGKVRALGFLWAPFFFLGVGPKVHASLWFDATTSYYRLHADDRRSLDVRGQSWTLGFSIGQDF